jgi:hypothetical protein
MSGKATPPSKYQMANIKVQISNFKFQISNIKALLPLLPFGICHLIFAI